MAFGAAIAGTVGDVTELRVIATPETVRAAVTWVYLFNALPLILAAAVAARFFQIAEPVSKEHRVQDDRGCVVSTTPPQNVP